MTWNEIAELISASALGHLATAGADGAPHVAQVGAVPEGDVIWMMTLRSTGKAQNMLANPRVALMWTGAGAETYVWGDVEFVDDLDERTRVFGAGIFPYDPSGFFGTPDNPDLLVIRVRPTRAVVAGGPAGPSRHRWSA